MLSFNQQQGQVVYNLTCQGFEGHLPFHNVPLLFKWLVKAFTLITFFIEQVVLKSKQTSFSDLNTPLHFCRQKVHPGFVVYTRSVVLFVETTNLHFYLWTVYWACRLIIKIKLFYFIILISSLFLCRFLANSLNMLINSINFSLVTVYSLIRSE